MHVPSFDRSTGISGKQHLPGQSNRRDSGFVSLKDFVLLIFGFPYVQQPTGCCNHQFFILTDNDTEHQWLKANAAIPDRTGGIESDDASVLCIDDNGKRFRLPNGHPAFDAESSFGWGRLAREVATERDLFNCHGTFYELPAENASGFVRVRTV